MLLVLYKVYIGFFTVHSQPTSTAHCYGVYFVLGFCVAYINYIHLLTAEVLLLLSWTFPNNGSSVRLKKGLL